MKLNKTYIIKESANSSENSSSSSSSSDAAAAFLKKHGRFNETQSSGDVEISQEDDGVELRLKNGLFCSSSFFGNLAKAFNSKSVEIIQSEDGRGFEIVFFEGKLPDELK